MRLQTEDTVAGSYVIKVFFKILIFICLYHGDKGINYIKWSDVVLVIHIYMSIFLKPMWYNLAETAERN